MAGKSPLKPGCRLALLCVFAILYFLSPIDLIPDPLTLLGRIDDLLVIVFVIYQYLQYKKAAQGIPEAEEAQSKRQDESSANSRDFDACAVLGVSKDANPAEIEQQYRNLAAKYHPDKVTHLGEEFQKMAHEKMVEIQKAYEMLK